MTNPGFLFIVKFIVFCYLVKISPTIRCAENPTDKTRTIPTFRQIYPSSEEEISTRLFSPDSMLDYYKNEGGCFQNEKPCLPLCCGIGMFKMNRVCVRDDELNSADDITVNGDKLKPENYDLAVSDICEGEERKISEFTLKKDGSVFLPRSRGLGKRLYKFGDYCLWRDYNSTKYIPKICINGTTGDDKESAGHSTTIERIGLIISTPFLLATFMVYTILPDLRNVHGKTLRGYVGCLAVAFVFLSILKNVHIGSKFVCDFTGYTALFSSLASYFWLNIMCFDIWRTFGRSQTRQRNIDLSDHDTYVVYSAYAWSCPILITAACLIMDRIPGIPKSVLRPGIGDQRCWFRSNEATAFYFYGPVAITFVANILMFVTTLIKMNQYQKKTDRQFRSGESKRHNKDKVLSYHVYVKLFIVMGISWFMEIISWFCNNQILWYITDTVNTLQGLTIFVVLVWTNRIKQLLADHWSVKKIDLSSTRFWSIGTRSQDPEVSISASSSNTLER